MDPAPQIHWKTLDELEASLRGFQRVYEEERTRRRELRAAVIKAKDRARFASRNPKAAPEKRNEKAEMVQWMLVWLDDPSMFADWVTLRRSQLGSSTRVQNEAPGTDNGKRATENDY